MSTGDTESIDSVNISNREKRTSRVLDAIHMFEQKTSPVGSPTVSNQDRKAFNRSYSYQSPRKPNSTTTDTMDDSPNKPKPALPPRNPNQRLVKRPTTVDTNHQTEPAASNGRDRSSHVEINERPVLSTPVPIPTSRSQLNFVPMPKTPPPKPPSVTDNLQSPPPATLSTSPHRLPTSASTHDIASKYREKALPPPPTVMGPPPTRPPPKAPEEEQARATEIASMKAAAESALTSKSSSSKLVYHAEAGSSFDYKKKEKAQKKEKKLPFGLKLNKQVSTDARIQEHLKAVGMDDLTSTLFNTVMKELHKRDTTFAVKQVQQRDWKEVETEIANADPSIVALIALERALAEGFKFEFGRNNIKYPNEIKVEDPERDVFYYRDYFTTKEHFNYLAEPPEEDKGVSAICISVEAPSEKESEKKCIIRTKKGNDRVILPPEGTSSEKEILKYIKTNYPECSKSKFVKITDPEFITTLTTMETKSIALRYKFGVLYVTDGQTDENEMFSNNVHSPDYDEFLEFLGEKIVLNGWPNYRGGLDVKNNTTGTHSVYTKHRGYELMYHVATLLPYQPDDLQRVERKRHLGNDIVVIIFKEGDQPFDPLCLTTHFNHVFCVVEKDKSRTDKTFYKVAIANKIGVPPYGPFFKSPPIYEKTEEFRDFLLTKLINAERASIEWAPEFRGKMVRTRKQILEDMAKDWIEKQKASGKRSFLGKGLGGTMEFLTSDD